MKENIDSIGELAKEKGYSLIMEETVKAIKNVDDRLKNPVKKVAGKAGELTAFSRFCEDANLKEHALKYTKNQWKTLKALAAGTVSLIPLINQVEGGKVASAELIDAAILEGATRAEAAALAKGFVVAGSGAVVEPIGRVVGRGVTDGVKKGLKAIDPFEDVPAVITATAGAAQIAGVPGALAVPALIQLAKNSFEMWSEIYKTGKDIKKAILAEVNNRVARAKSPEMVASVAAFA